MTEGTTLAWSSSASSFSSSSSSLSSSCRTRTSTFSELEEDQLIQKVVIVMYLQNIRYLKPRKTVQKSIEFYQHILQRSIYSIFPHVKGGISICFILD